MIRRSYCAILCLTWMVLPVGVAAAAETVRVDASSGAPRLMVDGKPVRARMFWGAPGVQPIRIGPTGRPFTFEFTPHQDEPGHATMHFRFGRSSGQIWLDDIRVTDLKSDRDVLAAGFEDGQAGFHCDWHIWPVGKANTVGTVRVEAGVGQGGSSGLHVTLSDPPAGTTWPDFHIYSQPNLALRSGRRYRVSMYVRSSAAREMTVAFYRPGQPYVFLGGPSDPFQSQIKLAAGAGVDFVSFPLHMPWPEPPREADWSVCDAQCRAVLAANPRALLLPRIGVEPPEWWYRAHDEDRMVYDQPSPKRRSMVVASPAYRRDAAERLGALVRHLEEVFGPRMAGYHPVAQNTGEWFYQETWGPALNGYSEGNLRAWRQWLRQRYRDDAALRAAWGDQRASLAEAAVPSSVQRRSAPAGMLRDPARERSVIDFTLFQQEAMADCVCHLAGAVRRASGGRKLVVFFYGYVFEFAAVANGPATSGHYALRRVLDCPDIDVLCSPISYFDRGAGHSGPAMTAAESIAMAGKMWLVEDDTRTYLGTGRAPGWQDGLDTLEATNHVLLRNTAQCGLRNFATWWMDLGATGWFNDERMWERMKRLETLDGPLLASPRPYRPEVAAVIDEAAMIRVAYHGHVLTRPGVYEVRRGLGRMGAPYGQYLQDDVAAGRVKAKLYVFLTPWLLSPAQRRALLAATRDGLRLWCYAPGCQEEAGCSPGAMQELTGLAMKKLSGVKATAQPTERGKELGLRAPLGIDQMIEPLFAVADAKGDEVLATYADGSAAVVLRQTPHGTSLFAGPPGLSSDLLRLAARRAGVHLYAQTDCNVYANGPWVAVHASQDGRVELDLGRKGAVRDVLTGRVAGQGPRLDLDLERGQTVILHVQGD
ncbi:MAG TPA: beta-galactosidase [Phycisphaerae bacterium]|nr:beta-galactosidase [Phycisphaerae bacterium]HQL72742.1 beta-galactosidase [Phycisphaerae bacterium]